MKTRLYSFLKFAVGWPLSVIAFLFIGKIIYDQAPTILPRIQTLNPTLFFYGVICLLLYYFLRTFIWQRILKGFGYEISLRETSYLWGMSELKRYIPGKVWAFLGRAVVFSKKNVEKKDIVKGMLIEVELFVIGCVIVSLLALPFLLRGFTSLVGWGAIFIVTIGVLIYVFNQALFAGKKSLTAQVDPGGSVLHILRKNGIKILLPQFHPQENILLITISTFALFFFGLGNYFIISAIFFLDPRLVSQLIGVFVFAFLTGFLSIVTPAGFGVREGILIYSLSTILTTGAGAFAALFSRVMSIVTELLFIGVSFVWLNAKIPALKKIEKWIATHPYESFVIVLAGIYTIYFATVSFLRYDHFYAGRFDLGNMAQTVWNSSRGNIFQFTNPDSTNEVSRLAFHADFILVLLAPFYWIWPDPRMILLIQTVVVAAGAYFIFLITKKVLNHQLLGVILAFAYLLNPSVQRVNIYDFHAPALATALLLGTFYFYLQKRYVWFVTFALLAAFCKEQIWAITAIFGVFLMAHHKKWIFGSLMFFVSVGMFYFLVSYAIPQSLGSTSHFALNYYADFGDSPAEVIKTMVLSPDKVLALFMEEERSKYLRQLFSPLGYLSLFAPWMLLFAGPDLMINLMSNNAQLHYIYYQYTAAITPFIFIAAIYGMWVINKLATKAYGYSHLRFRLITVRKTLFVALIFYILYNAVNTAYLYGPLPGAKEPNLDMFTKHEKNRELIDRTLAAIPADKKVAASNNVGAHLSNRRDIYVLPTGAEQADIVVFLLTNSEKGPSFAKEEELVKKLSADPKYRLVVQKDEFTVFEKL